MAINELEFQNIVDDVQRQIEEVIDDAGLDIDYENTGGVLTLTCEDGSAIIISRQAPLKQLWLATRGGGYHFDYDTASETWLDSRSGKSLNRILADAVMQQAGEEIDFEL